MAFYRGRAEHCARVTSTSTAANVPGHPAARLMYYLDCICTVLDLRSEPQLDRLRDYNSYYMHTNAEKETLLMFCQRLHPAIFEEKAIFCRPDLCGTFSHKFYELSAAKGVLTVPEKVMVAGRSEVVKEIMVYKDDWMLNYYHKPLRDLKEECWGPLALSPSPPPSPRRQVFTVSSTAEAHNLDSQWRVHPPPYAPQQSRCSKCCKCCKCNKECVCKGLKIAALTLFCPFVCLHTLLCMCLPFYVEKCCPFCTKPLCGVCRDEFDWAAEFD